LRTPFEEKKLDKCAINEKKLEKSACRKKTCRGRRVGRSLPSERARALEKKTTTLL